MHLQQDACSLSLLGHRRNQSNEMPVFLLDKMCPSPKILSMIFIIGDSVSSVTIQAADDIHHVRICELFLYAIYLVVCRTKSLTSVPVMPVQSKFPNFDFHQINTKSSANCQLAIHATHVPFNTKVQLSRTNYHFKFVQ